MQTTKPSGIDSDPNLLAFDSISTQFLQNFKLVVASTPKLREEVYKIRYKVYCHELKYEAEENFPNAMEQDVYDQRSIHCLLMHARSGLYAGCVRLVLPEPHSNVEANLPYQRVYGQKSQADMTKLERLPYGSFGEVSRLAVTAEFRKRERDAEGSTLHQTSAKHSNLVESDRRYFPLIALGLYLAATSFVQEYRLDGAVTLMEPRLARHLRRFGINCHQVGELVEFHGQRGLFHMSLEAVLSSMDANTQELFQMICLEVKKSLLNSNQYLPYKQAA
jgi:N-acyl amino acid synthase of PEP-CTERM/exosortase system